MSLQVNDPRSRTRSKSPAERKSYNPDEEAEIERQYKLINDERRRENDPRSVTRAPRSPARYDVNRSDSDSESKRRDRDADSSRRRRDDHYEHSDSERGSAAPAPSSRSHRRRPSPDRGSRVKHDDSDSADDLAYGDAPGSHPSYARPNRYSYAQPTHFVPTAPRPGYPAGPIDWASVPECERPGYVPPSSQPGPATMPGAFPAASTYPASSGSVPAPVIPSQYAGFPQAAYATSAGYTPAHYRTASATDTGYPPAAGYANPGVFQYAQIDPNVKYTSKAENPAPVYTSTHEQYTRPPPQQLQHPYYSQSQKPQQAPDLPQRHKQEPEFVEIAPGGSRSSARPHSHSVSSNTLAVAGVSAAHSAHPPASPLLEPYHGTYQSISPMPSPIVIPSIRDDDISDLEPLDGGTSASDSSRRSKHRRSHSSVSERDSRTRSSKDKKAKERDDRTDKRLTRPSHDRHDSTSSIDGKILVSPTTGRKRVSFYDAGPDAAAMQSALNHTRNIDSKPIIQILPRLTSDEIILLRAEYKTRVRMQGKGINLAKHLRLKLGSSSFGKVCYATALGRWESEAYWANCYYQAGTSRRELLIESLMGRSNAAIREIKNSFRDTRYDNSLERCMRSELRADKFRVAILLALEGQRQDDREPLDKRLIRDDVQDLYRAIVREGGETAMIHIIVLRSDSHLREVLRAYEDNYGQNFTRALIAKSRNLVGETLAHILNGAINRPMRDALLLHQALRESRTGRERSELLISRLVRLHWEPRHLDLVKNEYRRRYHERLEEAIAEEILSLNGGQDWGEFCIELARND
ncbi:Annexin [Penicillium cf. griseofulvum]|nr:Annexin [Penicillium cf. griseofulvum]